ncbi:MAG: glycosyltransferase family 9 protein [Kiritimatiellae bacterium]|nr:glycosyltransferase family 9 protein [Kiritimatiellia bacterium]
MKVVVIRTDHLGDTLLCTPLLRALAKAGHTVEVVVPEFVTPLLCHNPHVRELYSLQKIAPAFPRKWWRLGCWLHQQRYDAVILPYARPRVLLLASLFSGARIRIAMWSGVMGRLTFHHCLRSHLLTRPRHYSEVMLDCAKALGASPDGLQLDLPVPIELRQWACTELVSRFGRRPVIGIHPGCGGSACNLPTREYGICALRLIEETDTGVVVTGTSAERRLVKDWPAKVLTSPHVWVSMGELTLLQLSALVTCFSAYVVPSTAPLHIASSAGIPTVSPFCAFPTLSQKVWGNLGGKAVALSPPEAHCRDWRHKNRGHCEFSGYVTGEMLYEQVRRLLSP